MAYKMKRIRIWADTHSTGIFDDEGRFLLQEETTISDTTWSKLQNWVKDYDTIIPLSPKEREFKKALIEHLDSEGEKIMNKIVLEWSLDIVSKEKLSFVYCSEGNYQYN